MEKVFEDTPEMDGLPAEAGVQEAREEQWHYGWHQSQSYADEEVSRWNQSDRYGDEEGSSLTGMR